MCLETKIGTIFKTTVITLNRPGVIMILSNLAVPGNAHPPGGKIPLHVGRAPRSAGVTATTPSKINHL